MSEILTTKEAAEWLRVHPSTIYRLAKARKIPGFRVGSDFRFNKGQLDEWAANRTREAAPEFARCLEPALAKTRPLPEPEPEPEPLLASKRPVINW